jgi:hypothetical protein
VEEEVLAVLGIDDTVAVAVAVVVEEGMNANDDSRTEVDEVRSGSPVRSTRGSHASNQSVAV